MDINSWWWRAPLARRSLNICNCSEVCFKILFKCSGLLSSMLMVGTHFSVSGMSCLWQCSFIHYMFYCILFDLFQWLFHINVLVNFVSTQKPSFLQHSTLLFCFLFQVLHLFALPLQCSKTAGIEISVLQNKRITGVRCCKSIHGMNNFH